MPPLFKTRPRYEKPTPEIKEEALNQPVGPAELLISMTERRLHAEWGRGVNKMRVSDILLGCGQVLTGIAPRRTGPKDGERLSAECRAMQGAHTDRPQQGQAFCTSGLKKGRGILRHHQGQLLLHQVQGSVQHSKEECMHRALFE